MRMICGHGIAPGLGCTFGCIYCLRRIQELEAEVEALKGRLSKAQTPDGMVESDRGVYVAKKSTSIFHRGNDD